MLRLSWPTRRFNLPAHAPRWLWECLHLLGRAAPQASFDLQLPATWLTSEYGTCLFELLSSQFSLELLEGDPQGPLRMRFCKDEQQNSLTIFAGPFGPRQYPWNTMRLKHRALLLLQLALPDEILVLLDQERLTVRPVIDQKSQPGAELFIRSSLGSWLWNLVSAGRPLPTSAALLQSIARQGLPCPSEQMLQALQQACQQKTGGLPPVAIIDQEVNRLLGPLPPLERSAYRRRTIPPSAQCNDVKNAATEEIANAVFIDGIPRFPEQYLYNYFRPALISFSFSGPLTIGNEFFGRTSLFDSVGTLIEVENPDIAAALQLASQTAPSPILLPADRQTCAEITDRYRSDLLRLRQELLRRVHLAISESRAAELLAKRIWKELPLPDWSLLDSKGPAY
jgi:hypothetical protein